MHQVIAPELQDVTHLVYAALYEAPNLVVVSDSRFEVLAQRTGYPASGEK